MEANSYIFHFQVYSLGNRFFFIYCKLRICVFLQHHEQENSTKFAEEPFSSWICNSNRATQGNSTFWRISASLAQFRKHKLPFGPVLTWCTATSSQSHEDPSILDGLDPRFFDLWNCLILRAWPRVVGLAFCQSFKLNSWPSSKAISQLVILPVKVVTV